MSATLRSSASSNTASTPAGSLTLNMPSGYQLNDLLIAAIAVSGGTGSTITGPSGWTTSTTLNVTQTTNTRLNVFYRIATGYENTSYTWTFDTTRSASGFIADYEETNPFFPPSFTSTTTASASTTVSATDINSTYETGRTLQIVACNNTTAASTITAGSGYTKQIDTCTSASTFIEACLLDAAKGLPMGGLSSSTPTCSQSATSILCNLMVEDQRPAFAYLAEDEIVIGSWTSSKTSSTSQTYQTNYPNELLVCLAALQTGTQTVSNITGGGLVWSLVARENTNSGSSEVWCTFCPTPISNTNFVVSLSGSSISGSFQIIGFVGADLTMTTGLGAIGAIATGTSSAASPSISLTTTRNNSWVWAIMNEGTASAGTVTAGTNQTNIRSANDSTNGAAGWALRQNSLTPISGTSVTMNATAPSTDSCNIVAIEILPAMHYNLGATGVG